MTDSLELARAASWSNVPTNLLLDELRRRQDDGDKPECGSRGDGHYDTMAHVLALFLILVLSTLSCGFPLISHKRSAGTGNNLMLFVSNHIGTGVIISVGFCHLLPTAFRSLTDPCLPYFFSRGYTPLAGVIAMVSTLVVVGVESYLTEKGAGHSHAHGPGAWGDEDEEPLHTGVGLSERRAGSYRPTDISLNDMEATEGLVAGVSPFPDTPSSTRQDGKPLDADFGDGDSDLDLAELDPAEASSSQIGPYSQLNKDPYSTQTQSPEEQKRRLLQCLLLEAGILFHSVFIGMAISVATGPAFIVFLIAISFHQSFEGLALGTRIAAIQFPKNSLRPWLMVLAYGMTTPLGQAIGLIVHKLYDPQSMGGLLVVGFMNAISSGLLLYAALVQLLAEDFLSEKSYRVLRGGKRWQAYLSVVGGAVLMALVGAFA